MQALCNICSDLFDSVKDVAAIPCGHTFHTTCLDEWTKIQKTCPQCRLKFTTHSVISKLYFEIAEENGNEVDPAELKNTIKTLETSLLVKDKEKSDIWKVKEDLECRVVVLQIEKSDLEKGLKNARTEISALRVQLEFFSERVRQADAAKAETKVLRDKVKELQNMENIVNGTEKEAEEVLMAYGVQTSTTKPLITYCSVLKKQLQRTTDQKKRLQQKAEESSRHADEAANRAISLQSKLEQQAKTILDLKADLKEAEESQNGLRQKLKTIQESMGSPSGAPLRSAWNRIVTESPAPWLLNLVTSDSGSEDVLDTPSPRQVTSLTFSPDINTPRMAPPAKQKQSTIRNDKPPSFTMFLDKHVQRKRLPGVSVGSTVPSEGEHSNILTATNLGPNRGTGYNGLGGHSKPDLFPKPGLSGISKLKRPSKRPALLRQQGPNQATLVDLVSP